MKVTVPRSAPVQQSDPPPTVALSSAVPITSMSPDAVTNTCEGNAEAGELNTLVQRRYPALSSAVSQRLGILPNRGSMTELSLVPSAVMVPAR